MPISDTMGRIEFQLGRNQPLVSGQLLECEPSRLLVEMHGNGTFSAPEGSVHFAYLADGMVFLGSGTLSSQPEGRIEVNLTNPPRAYNRRNGPRRNCNIEISSRPSRDTGESAPWFISKCENISVGGCAFRISTPAENGSLMELRFSVPVASAKQQDEGKIVSQRLSGDQEGQRVRTTVRIARCRPLPEGGYMAHTEFRTLAPEVALCLAWYTAPLHES
jgi:hypothetical protein